MKELTRIITLEATVVIKNPNISTPTKEESAEITKNFLKDELNYDDVVITSVQDFERDIKGGKNNA